MANRSRKRMDIFSNHVFRKRIIVLLLEARLKKKIKKNSKVSGVLTAHTPKTSGTFTSILLFEKWNLKSCKLKQSRESYKLCTASSLSGLTILKGQDQWSSISIISVTIGKNNLEPARKLNWNHSLGKECLSVMISLPYYNN